MAIQESATEYPSTEKVFSSLDRFFRERQVAAKTKKGGGYALRIGEQTGTPAERMQYGPQYVRWVLEQYTQLVGVDAQNDELTDKRVGEIFSELDAHRDEQGKLNAKEIIRQHPSEDPRVELGRLAVAALRKHELYAEYSALDALAALSLAYPNVQENPASAA